jgi:drug/metabolite transporter (DMT)-like permease
MSDSSSSHAAPVDYVLLVVLATCWGAAYTFIKIGVETLPPVTLIAARTVIAGTLLYALMRLTGVRFPHDARSWRHFLFQAFMNSVIPFTLIAWGEQTVDAGLAVILNTTTPIFTFLITLAFTRHEPASARKLFGVVIGLAGVTLIIGVGALGGLGRALVAQLGIVFASVCYAGAVIFGRNFSHLNPMVPATGSLICGAAILIPASLVIDQPWTLAPSTRSLVALACLAVFSTALAFTIYFRLVRTLGSIGTTAQAYLRAPIGVAIGIALLGETLSPTAWIGFICVVVGVVSMTLPARKLYAKAGA